MISFDEAQKRLAEAVTSLESEEVSLSEASGRFLAAPVKARVDHPRSDQSAMDGYAITTGDATSLPDAFNIIGEARPGAPFEGNVGTAQAVRIFTGAPVPAGADRVIVQEITERDGDTLRLTGEFGETRHIRKAGSDFVLGARLLEVGQRLHPRALLAAAGSDNDVVTVHHRPRIALIATGDELCQAGSAAQSAHGIAESLSSALTPLIAEHGGIVVRTERLPDDLTVLKRVASELAGETDLVITTGGASVGEHDHAKAMFEPLGLDLIFSKVAIKPGKPVWLGRAGKTMILGLPGNPTSAMVTARLFLLPLLAALQGGDPVAMLGWRTAPLAETLPPAGARESFLRGIECDGKLVVSKNLDSGAQASLIHVDKLIRCPAGDDPIPAGSVLPCIDF